MAATGENCINDRQKLSVLANDLMLLAVSVIGAASYIVNQATSDMVSVTCFNSDLEQRFLYDKKIKRFLRLGE